MSDSIHLQGVFLNIRTTKGVSYKPSHQYWFVKAEEMQEMEHRDNFLNHTENSCGISLERFLPKFISFPIEILTAWTLSCHSAVVVRCMRCGQGYVENNCRQGSEENNVGMNKGWMRIEAEVSMKDEHATFGCQPTSPHTHTHTHTYITWTETHTHTDTQTHTRSHTHPHTHQYHQHHHHHCHCRCAYLLCHGFYCCVRGGVKKVCVVVRQWWYLVYFESVKILVCES